MGFNLIVDDTQFYLSFNVLYTETLLTWIIVDIQKWMDSKQLKMDEDKTVRYV